MQEFLDPRDGFKHLNEQIEDYVCYHQGKGLTHLFYSGLSDFLKITSITMLLIFNLGFFFTVPSDDFLFTIFHDRDILFKVFNILIVTYAVGVFLKKTNKYSIYNEQYIKYKVLSTKVANNSWTSDRELNNLRREFRNIIAKDPFSNFVDSKANNGIY